jgi:acyl-homoserine-lactone acylase
VYAAELLLTDLIRVCNAANDPALAPACAALQGWDKRSNLDSRGAVLFREFWNVAARIPGKYAVPFNPGDPVNTPHTMAPAIEARLLATLRMAVQKLNAAGVPLDGRLGDYQSLTRNGVRIPIHGGIGDIDGSYNATVMASDLSASGYQEVQRGVSYVQSVTFDDAGPVAHGLLVYGQSTDPKSPYYADQVARYSRKEWPALPFSSAAIRQDPNYKQSTLAQ